MSGETDLATRRRDDAPDVVVSLASVDARLRPAVLGLAPAPEQEGWSGRAAQTLPAAEADPARDPVAILLGGEPVGFFVIDSGDEPRAYAADGSVVLRAFFVDRRAQGRGVASAALRLVPDRVRRSHPDTTGIVLTVNRGNAAAIRVYRRAGWVDTGRLYRAGALGPQHVLELSLRAP